MILNLQNWYILQLKNDSHEIHTLHIHFISCFSRKLYLTTILWVTITHINSYLYLLISQSQFIGEMGNIYRENGLILHYSTAAVCTFGLFVKHLGLITQIPAAIDQVFQLFSSLNSWSTIQYNEQYAYKLKFTKGAIRMKWSREIIANYNAVHAAESVLSCLFSFLRYREIALHYRDRLREVTIYLQNTINCLMEYISCLIEIFLYSHYLIGISGILILRYGFI